MKKILSLCILSLLYSTTFTAIRVRERIREADNAAQNAVISAEAQVHQAQEAVMSMPAGGSSDGPSGRGSGSGQTSLTHNRLVGKTSLNNEDINVWAAGRYHCSKNDLKSLSEITRDNKKQKIYIFLALEKSLKENLKNYREEIKQEIRALIEQIKQAAIVDIDLAIEIYKETLKKLELDIKELQDKTNNWYSSNIPEFFYGSISSQDLDTVTESDIEKFAQNRTDQCTLEKLKLEYSLKKELLELGIKVTREKKEQEIHEFTQKNSDLQNKNPVTGQILLTRENACLEELLEISDKVISESQERQKSNRAEDAKLAKQQQSWGNTLNFWSGEWQSTLRQKRAALEKEYLAERRIEMQSKLDKEMCPRKIEINKQIIRDNLPAQDQVTADKLKAYAHLSPFQLDHIDLTPAQLQAKINECEEAKADAQKRIPKLEESEEKRTNKLKNIAEDKASLARKLNPFGTWKSTLNKKVEEANAKYGDNESTLAELKQKLIAATKEAIEFQELLRIKSIEEQKTKDRSMVQAPTFEPFFAQSQAAVKIELPEISDDEQAVFEEKDDLVLLSSELFEHVQNSPEENLASAMPSRTADRSVEEIMDSFQDGLIQKYPHFATYIQETFSQYNQLDGQEKIAAAINLSNELCFEHRIIPKEGLSDPKLSYEVHKTTAQQLDSLIQNIYTYGDELMCGDQTASRNILEKSLRIMANSMVGTMQNTLALGEKTVSIGSDLVHDPKKGLQRIGKGLYRKADTTVHALGTLTESFLTVVNRHKILNDAEALKLIEAIKPGHTAIIRAEQEATIAAIGETISQISEKDIAEYVVQPILEAFACKAVIIGTKTVLKKAVPLLEKLAVAVAERETVKPGFLDLSKAKKTLPQTYIPSKINGVFQDAKYHHPNSKGSVKSPCPKNGQKALDISVVVKNDGGEMFIGKRRIAVCEGEFVILDRTSPGVYHGHVRVWEDLEDPMKSALKEAKLVNSKGKIYE